MRDHPTLTTILNALRRVMTEDARVAAAYDGVLLAVGEMPCECLISKWRPVDAGHRVLPVRVSWPALESRSPGTYERLLLQVEPHALGFGLE